MPVHCTRTELLPDRAFSQKPLRWAVRGVQPLTAYEHRNRTAGDGTNRGRLRSRNLTDVLSSHLVDGGGVTKNATARHPGY
ncbi:hypothetical protein EVAR_38309_1 [Eumeta japonica]|uniref:Uncharacterized protein n=1 Tax=Eumeta variegata TaxID=151549 RepID=A0A4C1WAM3_EUMVA|nr:hypothetical protein EVAR_38309_1 [Eumeta japonica]